MIINTLNNFDSEVFFIKDSILVAKFLYIWVILSVNIELLKKRRNENSVWK